MHTHGIPASCDDPMYIFYTTLQSDNLKFYVSCSAEKTQETEEKYRSSVNELLQQNTRIRYYTWEHQCVKYKGSKHTNTVRETYVHCTHTHNCGDCFHCRQTMLVQREELGRKQLQGEMQQREIRMKLYEQMDVSYVLCTTQHNHTSAPQVHCIATHV